MNTNNFKIFVEALEALPESIKNNNVNMASIAIANLYTKSHRRTEYISTLCISPTFVVIISPTPKRR
jgi:hypothetical protein